jgi:acetyl esterase/lipase
MSAVRARGAGLSRILPVLTTVGVAALGPRVWRRYRELLDEVAPELRRFFLPITAYVPSGERSLPLFRLPFRGGIKPQPGVAVTEHRIGSDSALRVFVTTPLQLNGPAPALLYLHGGALVLGSPEFELPLSIAPVARELNAVVIAPKYRLAPEYPFPAAFEDAMQTLYWMRENAHELGIDADRITVFGGSAGGGLAAAIAQRCHDEAIALRAQTLIYPMLDDRTVLKQDVLSRRWMMNTPKSILFGWTAYLGRKPSLVDDPPQYAVPARRSDLSGLAPAWVGVGELDLFHDEAVAYADRLKAAGVPCELVTVPGMYHGADGLMPEVPSMKEFRRSMLDHVRAHL